LSGPAGIRGWRWAGWWCRSTVRTRPPRRRYLAYADSRYQRTLQPNGERGILFAPDLVGPAEEIVARLRADVAVREVSELRLELPYEFSLADYEQILHDVVHLVAPELGWRPRAAATGEPAEAEAS
jgi:hypothetical protein